MKEVREGKSKKKKRKKIVLERYRVFLSGEKILGICCEQQKMGVAELALALAFLLFFKSSKPVSNSEPLPLLAPPPAMNLSYFFVPEVLAQISPPQKNS